MKQQKSWEITDEFWERAARLIPRKERAPGREYRRKPGGGRPPMERESRKVLKAICYVPRTGIQWNALPKSLGSSSAVHRYFQFWGERGFFEALWCYGVLSLMSEAAGRSVLNRRVTLRTKPGAG